MSTKAYYAEIPERPTEVLQLRAFNDGTNRGCKIIDLNDEIAQEGWAQIMTLPSKVISIAGERITGYTFKNIQKMLTKCSLPIRLRLESLNNNNNNNNNNNISSRTPNSSDSESDLGGIGNDSYANPIYKKRKNQFSSTYNKSRNNLYTNSKPIKYQTKNKSRSKLTHTPTYSNESNTSGISINLQSPHIKQCKSCDKNLKQHKQHRCRRCANIICSKCSKNKRKEVGYDKLVRVCDICVKRDEFTVKIDKKPLGISIGPLYGKTNNIGGILIINVKDNGGIKDIENKKDIKFDKSVIIAIGKLNNGKMRNIELLTYNNSIEILRVQQIAFWISCKKWNRNTKKSAKQQLEKEHQELIAQFKKEQLEKEAMKDAVKEKKKNSKNSKQDRPSSAKSQHHRNGTDSSFTSYKSENESPLALAPNDNINNFSNSAVQKPDDLFGSTINLERYAGSNEIDDHPAMKLIELAEESEKNNDIEQAAIYYKDAIKQFTVTMKEIDNNKIKRKWREKINDYEIQRLRINRKLKLRKKITKENRLKPGKTNRRSNTMQPIRRKNRKSSNDYTSDMKSEADKAKGNNNNNNNGDGDNNGNDKKDKKDKQDSAFRSRLEADIISEKPNVSFKDVMGLANVKLAIYETVILPQKRPELFTGLRAPAMGLLLFGPPGNGKTMIAKCVATEIDSTFFSISASSITSKYVGDAERIMRTLFGMAREKAPSIIFIDEIDSLLTARGGNNEAESSRRIKTEFLVQFDGVHSAKDLKASILVVGATNLPDQLDEAVLRRFSKRILVPHPEYDTRYGLIRSLMRDEPHTLSENDFVKIAKSTDRYSCSDLAHLCKDAALGPLREMGAVLVDDDFDESNLPKTAPKHFENSLKNVRSSLSKESLVFYRNWDKKFGSKFTLSVSELPEFLQPKPIEPLE